MILFDRYPGGKKYACTFSYDDGCKQDRRLVELFNKYGMKCTFNMNSSNMLNTGGEGIKPHELSTLFAGHEIAAHAHNHPHLERMPLTAQYDQIIKDREILEPHYGKIIRGLAYPFGTYSEDTFTAMKTAGIVYGRTVASNPTTFAPPATDREFLAWAPTTHHNEAAMPVKRFIYNVEKAPWRAGGLLYIWGHSYEFDNAASPVKWEEFEGMLAQLAARSYDIWFATNIEVYDYIKATQAIRSSADGKLLYNPTDTDVWVSNGSENVKIPAASSVKIQ